MKHVIQHDLDEPLAKRVVDSAFAAYAARYPAYKPSLAWRSDRRADVGFDVKGVKLSGSMTLGANEIDLELDVPFLLRPFQNKALEVIEREVRLWVAKAQAGEV